MGLDWGLLPPGDIGDILGTVWWARWGCSWLGWAEARDTAHRPRGRSGPAVLDPAGGQD